MVNTGVGALVAGRLYRNVVLLLAVAMLAIVALTTVGGRPAQAIPTDCSAYAESRLTGVAMCYGGTGYFRVKVYCDYPWPAGSTTRTGPWRAAGTIPSRQSCPLTTYKMDVYLNTISEL
jgi:hypothetical protein